MFKATLSFITASSVGPSGMIQTHLENPAAAWKSIKFIHSHSIHFQTGAESQCAVVCFQSQRWLMWIRSTQHLSRCIQSLSTGTQKGRFHGGCWAEGLEYPQYSWVRAITPDWKWKIFFPACTVDACRVTPSVFISFFHCSFFHLAEIATRCGYTRYVLISGEDNTLAVPHPSPPTDWWYKTMAQCSLGQHQEHQGVQLPATKLIKYCSLFFLKQP